MNDSMEPKPMAHIIHDTFERKMKEAGIAAYTRQSGHRQEDVNVYLLPSMFQNGGRNAVSQLQDAIIAKLLAGYANNTYNAQAELKSFATAINNQLHAELEDPTEQKSILKQTSAEELNGLLDQAIEEVKKAQVAKPARTWTSRNINDGISGVGPGC